MKMGLAFGVATLTATIAPLAACANQQGNQATTAPPSGAPPGTETMTTQLKSADGTMVANATIDFANGYATVTVEAGPNHVLTQGFHGLHIHSVGKCEANSVSPTGGATGDFNSAGGHFQAPGHTGSPPSGNLTSLEVRPDGSAKLVTTTSSFSAADLRNSSGTALIIHQEPDNFGNIPNARYNQKNGTPGPDEETLATGDAGKRVACGVIVAASTTSSTAPTPTVATITSTTEVPPPSTSTSTVTVTSSPSGAPSTPTTTTPPSLPPGT